MDGLLKRDEIAADLSQSSVIVLPRISVFHYDLTGFTPGPTPNGNKETRGLILTRGRG